MRPFQNTLPYNNSLYIIGQSDSFNDTTYQAELLQDQNVTVYSVGVGQYAAITELLAMASDQRYVFTVDDYDTIDSVAGPLADITCHGRTSFHDCDS